MALAIHRGAGKSIFSVNHLIIKALQDTDPLAVYVYLSPQKTQCKANVWDVFKLYLSHLPRGSVVFNEAELKITLPHGAVIRLLGANDPDNLRGMHLSGIIMDEVAQMPAPTWDEVVFPMLQAKKAWAVFIGTPKGQNLFYDLFQKKKKLEDNPDPKIQAQAKHWHSMLLDVFQTGVFNDEEISEFEANRGDAFQQEYMCSFTAAIKGTFYGKSIEQLYSNGQVIEGLYDPAYKVYTSWDLGNKDSTAIWFAQVKDEKINIIDFYENSDIIDLEYYFTVLKSKPYSYKVAFVPHDIKQGHVGMAQTRLRQFREAGLTTKIMPKIAPIEGINAVRKVLKDCYFVPSQEVTYGLKCLMNYKAKYNEKLGMTAPGEVHDWASHAADSFRYMILGLRDYKTKSYDPKINSEYNFFMHESKDTYPDYDPLKI